MKTIDTGKCVLETSKVLVNERYYEKMQTFSGKIIWELHFIDIDFFLLSFKPIKDPFEGLEFFRGDFLFSDLDPSNRLFSE